MTRPSRDVHPVDTAGTRFKRLLSFLDRLLEALVATAGELWPRPSTH